MSAAKSVRGLAMRFTRTDACGVPQAEVTVNSRLTTAAFVTIGLTPDVFEGDDIEITAANGNLCIDDKGTDTLKGIDLEMEICDVNESLLEMLLAWGILTDYLTPVEQVGFVAAASNVALGLQYTMLEVWSRNASDDACAVVTNPGRPYFHWLFPLTSRWQLSDIGDFGNNAQTLTLTGYSENNTNFAASRAADEWTVADVAAIQAGGAIAGREVVALPAQIPGSGFDL